MTLIALALSILAINYQPNNSTEPVGLIPEKLECTMEISKVVYQVDEPISVGVRLKNKDKQSQYFTDWHPLVVENFKITDQQGNIHPYLSKRPAGINDILRDNPIEWRPNVDRGIGVIDINKAYGIKEPGEYKIRARYPLNVTATQFAESNEITILVIPANSIKVELKAAHSQIPSPSNNSFPIKISLQLGVAPEKVQLKHIILHVDKGFIYGYISDRQIKNQFNFVKETTDILFDLNSTQWNKMISSIAPIFDIREFISPGEKILLSAELNGLYQGKSFQISTDSVQLEIGNFTKVPQGKIGNFPSNKELQQSIAKPINNNYYNMATEVRLCIVIPNDQGHAYGYIYNLACARRYLGSIGNKFSDILLSRDQMYQVLYIIMEKHKLAWQGMTAASPYPKDDIFLLIYSIKHSDKDSLQCTIGKAKNAVPILQELVPWLPESSRQNLQMNIKKLDRLE
jgi:hypothetical protein